MSFAPPSSSTPSPSASRSYKKGIDLVVEPKVGDGENNLITNDYADIFYRTDPDE